VLCIAFGQGAVGSSLWLGSMMLGPFVLHPLTLMYVVSGALMVSTFRIPKP
jgi:CDP-diacylglycerol--serine O-phosphatidyltransferase